MLYCAWMRTERSNLFSAPFFSLQTACISWALLMAHILPALPFPSPWMKGTPGDTLSSEKPPKTAPLPLVSDK